MKDVKIKTIVFYVIIITRTVIKRFFSLIDVVMDITRFASTNNLPKRVPYANKLIQ